MVVARVVMVVHIQVLMAVAVAVLAVIPAMVAMDMDTPGRQQLLLGLAEQAVAAVVVQHGLLLEQVAAALVSLEKELAVQPEHNFKPVFPVPAEVAAQAALLAA
jgi:hypothetical protein